jgi:hypothetical protein
VHNKPRTFLNSINERKLRIGLCAFRGSAVTEFKPTDLVSTSGPTLGFVATGMGQRSSDDGVLYETNSVRLSLGRVRHG